MKRIPIILALFLFLALPTAGCAALAKWLPTVITALVESNTVLDSIESVVGDHLARNPDPELELRFQDGLMKTRAALATATALAKGGEAASREDLSKAFAEFEMAYAELLKLVGPLNLVAVSEDGTLQADVDGKLSVPSPEALSPEVVE